MKSLLYFFVAAAIVDGAKAQALECGQTVESQVTIDRWEQQSALTLSRDSHTAAVFQDSIYLVGGVSSPYYTKRLEYTNTRSDVVSSKDGVDWVEVLEEAPFRRRYGHSLTTLKDTSDGEERLVLAGGFSPLPASDIWTTVDGENWVESSANVPWTGRGYHCAVVFDEKYWILGGSPFNNEVWSTSSIMQGDWKRHDDAKWSPRAAHGCAAHKVMMNSTLGDTSLTEFLYVTGGWDGTSLQDVWRMDKAGEWQRIVEAAPWSKRAWHSLVSFDSRTMADVQYGPRLWLIGGGIVGNGIDLMQSYSDAWFTWDGIHWESATSDASGVSTAEWSMVSVNTEEVCVGKWGHAVVSFHQRVPIAFYCDDSCSNEENTVGLGGQLIPVCDPKNSLPQDPMLQTIIKDNSIRTVTLYPDGCGLCSGPRYYNTTYIPSLFLIAGNAGAQKVNDVFANAAGMLCEKNGAICGNQGVCTLGGTCLCNTGKTGPYCEDEADFVIVNTTSCFPDYATVYDTYGQALKIGDVKVGDKILGVNKLGAIVPTTVYYLPHEDQTILPKLDYLRITHMRFDSTKQEILDITPEHLVYVVQDVSLKTVGAFTQKAAREIHPGDLLLVTSTTSSSMRLSPSQVLSIDNVRLSKTKPTTVYTTTGTMLVESVLCSNFGDFYPMINQWRDGVPFYLFGLHRFTYGLLPYGVTARIYSALTKSLIPIVRRIGEVLTN